MKAQERHKLKSNELADSIVEISHFLTRHGSRILIGTLIVLIVVVGGFWTIKKGAQAEYERADILQKLTVQSDQMRMQAAEQARLEADPQDESAGRTYNVAGMISSFGELAQAAAGTPVGIMALFQQADAVRSELFFADRLLSDQEKQDLHQRAEKIYERIINEYPGQPVVAARAKLGLAVIAEDRGDWPGARRIYEQIASGDEQLAGTVLPLLAGGRLKMLDEISTPIFFPPAPPETPKQAEPTTDNADTAGDTGKADNTGNAGKADKAGKEQKPSNSEGAN